MSNDFPQTIKASPRPWLRIVKGIVVSLILFFLGAIGLMEWNRYQARNEFEAAVQKLDKEDPNWRLDDLRNGLAEIPKEKNSAVIIGEIFAGGNPLKIVDYDKLSGLDDLPPNMLANEQMMRDLNEFLKDIAPVLEKARTLKDFPDGRFPEPEYKVDFFSTTAEHLPRTRELAYRLILDSRSHLQNNEIGKAWDSTLAALHCSESLHDENLLIAALVRIAVRAMVLNQVERLVNQSEIPDNLLQEIQQQIDRVAEKQLLVNALRGERAGLHQIVSAVRDNRIDITSLRVGKPDQMTWWSKIQQRYATQVLFQSFPSFVEDLQELIEIAELPPAEQHKNYLAKASEYNTDAPFGSSESMTDLFMQGMIKTCQAAVRDRGNFDCARTGLAVEQFRRKNQRLPNTLQELVESGLLPSIPIDPYNGEPLQYRQSKKGAIVFSVGPDKDNEGGSLDDPYLQYPRIRIEFRIYLRELRRQPFQMPQFPDGEEFLP